MAKTVIFHCGSAKTGSTTLQNELWESRDRLESAGYHYCPRFIRAGNVDPLNEAIRNIRWGDREAAIAAGQKRLAALFGNGYHTVIVSNESAVGDPFHDSTPGFFPHLTRSLSGLCDMFEGVDVKPFFVVRSQAGLLPSFYTQRVRQGASYTDRYYYERLLQGGLSWVPVIEAIQQSFPALTVRPFEQVKKAKVSLAGAVLGDAIEANLLPKERIPVKNRAASARAVRAMRSANGMAEKLLRSNAQAMKGVMRRLAFRQIEWLIRGDTLSLPPEVHKQLQEQYGADIEALF